MNLLFLIRKSLRQHLLSTCVTVLSLGLASGLMMAVWSLKDQATEAFTGFNCGFDAVIGARSSKTQLVLNSIFHLDVSPGNLKADQVRQIEKNPHIKSAIPIAVGDNLRGFRIVGVTTNLFQDIQLPGFNATNLLAAGRIFDPSRREAVVGNFAARKLGLGYGDTFQPYHGVNFAEDHQHDETYVVVGVLRPTGTPLDKVVWIPLAGVQHMEGHNPGSADEVSALLLRFTSSRSGFFLDQQYNKQESPFTLAWPLGDIMARLFQKISWFDQVLTLISYLIGLVAVGSVLTSIYNTMNERRRTLAIFRALGARKSTLFLSVLGEAIAIGVLGVLVGWILQGGLMMVIRSVLQAQTGVLIQAWSYHPVWFWASGLFLLACIGAGLVPAWKGYRTEVAENLSPLS